MQASDRLIVAADLSGRDDILRLADALRGVAGVLKIGLQAFVSNGPALVRELVGGGHRIFLDLKLHDIPNTVEHAAAEAASLGASMLTVHATGGASMLRAAARDGLLVLGVTVLTSLGEEDLREVGMIDPPAQSALRLARLSRSAGLGGVIASPQEIRPIREACGEAFQIVTPGIRAEGGDRGDQRRTMTAEQAVREGADYIVVGRPITAQPDRRAAALQVIAQMQKGGA